MKIAIFGGSFNPVHLGHTALAQRVAATGVVDEVWLTPSPLNPLKQDRQQELCDYPTRLHLARLATAGLPGVNVCDIEGSLPQPSYTCDTLKALRAAHPDIAFYLLIGDDNWRRFAQWRNADEIRLTTPILVYGRRDEGITLHLPDGTTKRVEGDFPLYPISGTMLRNAFRSDSLIFCKQWLHPDVYQYLYEHGTYELGFFF